MYKRQDAAPACRADVRLFVEKTETRQDGRSLILSAIVTAEIRLLVPKQLTYLSGGEGVVCDLRPARISRLYTCLLYTSPHGQHGARRQLAGRHGG